MEKRIDERVWFGGEGHGKYSYRINEVKLPLDSLMTELPKKIAGKLSLKENHILSWRVARESIDARNKSNIFMVYTVDFTTDNEIAPSIAKKQKCNKLKLQEKYIPVPGNKEIKGRAVVVGFGPCGIFAALELAEYGYKPIVLERGKNMNGRIKDIELFNKKGEVNCDSNMLFGEGGAGTFSDGKLTSGIKDANIKYVLETFANAGAGDEIIYKNRPHIGTDVLRSVIVRLREKIIDLGGEIMFNTRLTGLEFEENELKAVKVAIQDDGKTGDVEHAADTDKEKTDLGNQEIRIETNVIILATGHSARDTYEILESNSFEMEQKPLSIGVRIEHPQELIDKAQYGDEKRLPPAEYKLSYKTSNSRGVYSFCMCPGGEVVTCTTQEGEICVNGMSNRLRNSGTANSGILCDVRVSDFCSEDVLAGVAFQRKYEKLAFENGGSNYLPPTCTMKEFLNGSSSPVINSLPMFAYEAIKEAIPFFANKIHGYDDDNAIIKAVETRSSAPVRVLRDKTSGESTRFTGIYPAGEGCGYAGGITSAACDGIRQADNIIERYARPLE